MLKPTNTTSSADRLTARIDSQDVSFAIPIRQYLESQGCTIITGDSYEKNFLYHIVAGDELFVKTIFSAKTNDDAKRLVLLFSESDKNIFPILSVLDAKIVLLPPKQLSARELERTFAHFFAGESTTLNLYPPKTIVTDEAPGNKQEDIKRIEKTMEELFENNKKPTGKKSQKQKNHQHVHTFFIRILLLFFLFVGLPIVWYALSLVLSIAALGTSSTLFLQGKQGAAAKFNRVAIYWISQGKGVLHLVAQPVNQIKGGEYVRQQEQFWSVLDNVTRGQEGVERVVELGQTTVSALVATQGNEDAQTGTLATNIERIRNDLFFIQNHFGLAQAQLTTLVKNRSFPFFTTTTQTIGGKAETQLGKLRNNVVAIDNFLSLYQKIGGFKGKKTYLILFQNNTELRPTGGFIGSVGLATLTDGKLADLQVQDVYAVDGQLKGHVDPPVPIAQLLNQEHWYLRDSNWDPDFSVSGAKAAWFYEKETGIVVDGVIAVNMPLIVDLLAATGPIQLTDYNDRITAENFFGKSLFYTQSDFFPGSTQKKDFLGTLATSLITRLTKEKGVNAFSVFRAVAGGLEKHDMLFFFADPQLETLASRLGWGGIVPAVFGDNGYFDYFYAVDANLSVNKVNYFIKQELVRAINIGEDGKIQESITISYKNTSQGDSGGGGVYRNFVRFIVPADSVFNSITIDGEIIRSKAPTRQGLPFPQPPYTTVEEAKGGLSVIGLAFDVPPNAERRVVVSYQRMLPFVPDDDGNLFHVYHQKQPGVSSVPLQTTITYPIFWTGREEATTNSPCSVCQQTGSKQVFLAKEAQLLYNTTLSRDNTIRIRFTK